MFTADTPAKRTRSPSLSEMLWWPADDLGYNTFAETNTLKVENHFPEKHFDISPRVAGYASQLSQPTRIPASPRVERLQMRGSQGIIMGVSPIDPLHVAALHSERSQRRQESGNRALAASAPLQPFGLRRSSLNQETPSPAPLAPLSLSAPIPQIPPLTPQLPKVMGKRRPLRKIMKPCAAPTPDDRPRTAPKPLGGTTLEDRPRTAPEAAAGQTTEDRRPRTAPEAANNARRLKRNILQDSLDLEHCPGPDADVALLDDSGKSPRCTDNVEFGLTIVPASPALASPRVIRTAEEADDSLQSPPEGASLELLFGSTDTGGVGDPLAASSWANVSTMIDESSIWDQMWSVIGSGQEGSVWGEQDSQIELGCSVEALPSFDSIPQPPPVISKKSDGRTLGRAASRQRVGGSVPGAHRPARPKPKEAIAKKKLCAATPLHVRGIDRFLQKLPAANSEA